ncbi:protein PELPK1 isoform X2 [Hyalella azteca]|uniref:Protein PELPK1 isoform X2 n=1 Tax=Hyalella azteca TaxID=294128 RepID=A0A8B7PAP2_HYAAZ|nr:protein PELPK1 isoform X2 [Hyalella azteca]
MRTFFLFAVLPLSLAIAQLQPRPAMRIMPYLRVDQQTQFPSTPKWPEMPKLTEMPDMPKSPEMPKLPETPEMPKVPEMPKLPEMPEMPKLPEMPETPKLAHPLEVWPRVSEFPSLGDFSTDELHNTYEPLPSLPIHPDIGKCPTTCKGWDSEEGICRAECRAGEREYAAPMQTCFNWHGWCKCCVAEQA